MFQLISNEYRELVTLSWHAYLLNLNFRNHNQRVNLMFVVRSEIILKKCSKVRMCIINHSKILKTVSFYWINILNR